MIIAGEWTSGGLARTISRETGKPIAEARREASRVGDLLRLSWFEGSHPG